jgi:hypothetical protein
MCSTQHSLVRTVCWRQDPANSRQITRNVKACRALPCVVKPVRSCEFLSPHGMPHMLKLEQKQQQLRYFRKSRLGSNRTIRSATRLHLPWPFLAGARGSARRCDSSSGLAGLKVAATPPCHIDRAREVCQGQRQQDHNVAQPLRLTYSLRWHKKSSATGTEPDCVGCLTYFLLVQGAAAQSAA